jgi:hypothetical protein
MTACSDGVVCLQLPLAAFHTLEILSTFALAVTGYRTYTIYFPIANCAVNLCKFFKGYLQQYTISTVSFNYRQSQKIIRFHPYFIMMCEGCLLFKVIHPLVFSS